MLDEVLVELEDNPNWKKQWEQKIEEWKQANQDE